MVVVVAIRSDKSKRLNRKGMPPFLLYFECQLPAPGWVQHSPPIPVPDNESITNTRLSCLHDWMRLWVDIQTLTITALVLLACGESVLDPIVSMWIYMLSVVASIPWVIHIILILKSFCELCSIKLKLCCYYINFITILLSSNVFVFCINSPVFRVSLTSLLPSVIWMCHPRSHHASLTFFWPSALNLSQNSSQDKCDVRTWCVCSRYARIYYYLMNRKFKNWIILWKNSKTSGENKTYNIKWIERACGKLFLIILGCQMEKI